MNLPAAPGCPGSQGLELRHIVVARAPRSQLDNRPITGGREVPPVLLAHRGAVWCRADRAALNGTAMRSHSPEPSAALDERHVLKQAAMFISPMSAFAPHCGLKSDIAPCLKSAKPGSRRPKQKPPEGGLVFASWI
jgi:hypothetical protein